MDKAQAMKVMAESHRETVRELEGTIKSMKSEINYALNSNKSDDIKRFYLENAIRFANRALEGES